jgi:hypothetical protein
MRPQTLIRVTLSPLSGWISGAKCPARFDARTLQNWRLGEQ